MSTQMLGFPRRLVGLLLLGAVAVLAASLPAAADWSLATPGSELVGASIANLVAAPSQPSVVYAALALGGVAKSIDAGASWQWANQGLGLAELGYRRSGLLRVSAITVDPRNPDVLYAGAVGSLTASGPGSIVRSVDGGAHWTFRGGPRAADGSYVAVNALAIDPRPALHLLYAATGAGLFRSNDQGATWSPLRGGLLAADGVTPLAVSRVVLQPGSPDTIWAMTFQGLFRSRNRGTLFARRQSGLPASFNAYDLVISAASQTAYLALNATGSVGVWRSANQGASWTPGGELQPGFASLGLRAGTPDQLLYVAFSPSRRVFASSDGAATWQLTEQPARLQPGVVAVAEDWLVGGRGGVARSEDGGATFVESSAGLTAGVDVFSGTLAVAPSTGSLLVVLPTATAHSADRGASFELIAGVSATGPWPLAFASSSPQSAAMVGFEPGWGTDLFRSSDGGGTFSRQDRDPSAFGTAYSPVAVAHFAGSPDRLILGELGGGSLASDSGLYRSLDGGVHWTKAYTPAADLMIFQPESFAPDPTAARLFVGVHWRHGTAFTEGVVLRSKNGGAGFDQVLDGLAFTQVSVGKLGVGTRRGVVYAGGGPDSVRQGLWRSLDHGTTWTRLAGGLPVEDGHSIDAITADWSTRGRVFALVDGLPWVSRNDGETWQPLSTEGLPYGFRAWSLAIDPGLAGQRTPRVWLGTDQGLYWLQP